MDGPVAQDVGWITIIALAVALVSLGLVIFLAVRQSRILRTYRSLLNGPVGHDLESILLAHAERLKEAERRLEQLAADVLEQRTKIRSHVQKTGIVRFNAFPDTGSDLSFAIALLDEHHNGIVLSSLYGRSESRIYAKPIRAGKSSYALSEEERAAINQALNGQ